jgi:hypothetical protein
MVLLIDNYCPHDMQPTVRPKPSRWLWLRLRRRLYSVQPRLPRSSRVARSRFRIAAATAVAATSTASTAIARSDGFLDIRGDLRPPLL